MKRIIIATLFVISITSIAFCDDGTSTTANTNSNSNAILTTYGGDYSSIESPSLIQANKIDGSNIGIPGAYRAIFNSKSLFLEDFEFKVLQDPTWTGEISVSTVKNISEWRFFKNAIATGVHPKEVSETTIEVLNFIPSNAKAVCYRYVEIKNQAFPLVSMYNGLDDAREVGKHAKYYSILYRTAPVTIGKVLAFGLAGVNSTAHAGSSMPGKSVSSGAFGSGFGTAKSWVEPGGAFLIIGWDSAGEKETTKLTPVSAKEEIKTPQTTIFNLSEAKTVFFDFDKYDLGHPKQLEAIENNVKVIIDNITKLQPNEIFLYIGSASEEGSIEYNQVLGRNRAHAVYVAVLKKLYERGYSLDIIKSKIQFCSNGKEFPENIQKEMNREVCLKVLRN